MASNLVPQSERSITRALRGLPADEWVVLDGVAVPGRRRTTVEHVVAGPTGVFVVSVLVPDARGGDKAAVAVREATDALRELCSVARRGDVHAVLCVATDAPVDGFRLGAIVCSTSTIVDLISERRTVLAPDEVRDAALEIDAATGPRTTRRRRASRGSHRLDQVPRRRWRLT